LTVLDLMEAKKQVIFDSQNIANGRGGMNR